MYIFVGEKEKVRGIHFTSRQVGKIKERNRCSFRAGTTQYLKLNWKKRSSFLFKTSRRHTKAQGGKWKLHIWLLLPKTQRKTKENAVWRGHHDERGKEDRRARPQPKNAVR